MTAKRDSKRKPKAAKRPKLKKETLKDLQAGREGVKGGGVKGKQCTHPETTC